MDDFEIIFLARAKSNSHYYARLREGNFTGVYSFKVSSMFKVCEQDLVYNGLTMRPPESASEVEELCWGFQGMNKDSRTREEKIEAAFKAHISS